jgi:hypothetical protein
VPFARDPAHWLFRLDATEWLAAAETELTAASDKFRAHSQRAGVTHCRRGAGMALNAVLVHDEHPRPQWGRSYMEHVVALATCPPADLTDDASDITPEIVQAAERLRATPTQAPPLVQLGRRGEPDPSSAAVLAAAQAIVAWARARVALLAGRTTEIN